MSNLHLFLLFHMAIQKATDYNVPSSTSAQQQQRNRSLSKSS